MSVIRLAPGGAQNYIPANKWGLCVRTWRLSSPGALARFDRYSLRAEGTGITTDARAFLTMCTTPETGSPLASCEESALRRGASAMSQSCVYQCKKINCKDCPPPYTYWYPCIGASHLYMFHDAKAKVDNVDGDGALARIIDAKDAGVRQLFCPQTTLGLAASPYQLS